MRETYLALHIGVGGICCAVTGATWVYTNRNLLSIRSILAKKKDN